MCVWSGARGKKKSFLACFYSIFARNFPIAVITFGIDYYPLPWRSLEHPAFGVWFLGMGLICAGLAWYAFAMKDGPVELLDERNAERWARRKADASSTEEAVPGNYQPVMTEV